MDTSPVDFIIHFGLLTVDKCGKYSYVRIYCVGLDVVEARMLRQAYPNTLIRKYEVKTNPDYCWRWTSGGLTGLDQVVRDLRMSARMDFNFIECMWMYVWGKNRHRAEMGRRIRKMIGARPMEIRRILRKQPKRP